MRVDISVSIILIPKDTEKVSFLFRKRKRIVYLKGRLPVIDTEIWIVDVFCKLL